MCKLSTCKHCTCIAIKLRVQAAMFEFRCSCMLHTLSPFSVGRYALVQSHCPFQCGCKTFMHFSAMNPSVEIAPLYLTILQHSWSLLYYKAVYVYICNGISGIWSIVEPRLTDTPEMRPSTIMRTLRSVWNAIPIDLHAIRPPEIWTPPLFRKADTWLGPNSITTHTNSCS